MKKLQLKALGLALLAVIAFGGATASAKQTGQQILNGTIVSIDRDARTLTVREQGTNRVLTVRVPAGKTLRTNLVAEQNLPIERLLPGMSIRNIVVQ